MKNIELTQNELSEILHLYHQGRISLEQNLHCQAYEAWLEKEFGNSFFYLENLPSGYLYHFEFDEKFYLHLIQPQPEISNWLDNLKFELEEDIYEELEEIFEEISEISPIQIFEEFCDRLAIDFDEIEKSDFISETIFNWSNKNLLN